MNCFVTTLCLIAISKCAFADECFGSEPGKYSNYDTCASYTVCAPRVYKEAELACPPGTAFHSDIRECIAEHLVDCKYDDNCKNLEPGKYPFYDMQTCTEYVVCTGVKGSGIRGPVLPCPAGTRFDKYQRECIAEHLVDCNWCMRDFHAVEVDHVEDPTSKAHFFTCVGPNRMEHARRFKCNKGDFDPETKRCGGTPKEMKVMNLKTDATLDDHKNKTAFAEEARKMRPTGLCRPCRKNNRD